MTMPATGVPVIVAGGGPVGLAVAALLGRFGIRSLVVEADDGYCIGSRAICLSRRSLEILAWIGAERAILDIGLPWVGGRSYFRDVEVLLFTMPSEPDQRFAPMVNVQQYHVEEAIDQVLDPMLTTVRRSTRVVDVRSRDDGVEVDLVRADGVTEIVSAQWLVACDGGRSTVRERLGLELHGLEYEGRYVIVDIEQASSRAVERLAWFDPPSNPGSTVLMHRQPGDVWRIDYQIRDGEDPQEAVRPENVLPRVQSHLEMIGEDAPWKPLWISIYNAKCLTLEKYRHGRVVFAGDAAHLVPIFGVRGLNSGLDDAGNLAWKLASVLSGSADGSLLDTYTDERLHAARENMRYGAKSTEFMAPPHFGFRLMREAALRLATQEVAVRSLINPRQSTPIDYVLPANQTPDAEGSVRPGRPAPDARVRGAVGYLSQLFGNGFIELVFEEDESASDNSGDLPSVASATASERWFVARSGEPGHRRVVDREGLAWERYGARSGFHVMVRPDGYVAACFVDERRNASEALAL